MVVECGGTVGDIESQPFIEAFRQMRLEDGLANTFFVHVTLAPQLDVVGEMKTKPTQHSVQELRRIGIQPDMIIVRSTKPLSKDAREKIALFTSVSAENVISNPDLGSIYEVPEVLYNEGILKPILRQLRIRNRKTDLSAWKKVVGRFVDFEDALTIAMVGKYVTLNDSYVSVNQALQHAAAANGVGLKIRWIESEDFEGDPSRLEILKSVDGIVLPQGYGKRGTEGKIAAANYAREERIPLLGLCFGFQLSIVSFARNVLGLEKANSTEIDPVTPDPVIDLLPEQRKISDLGGTMRLGGHDITILKPSRAFDVYNSQDDTGQAQAQVRAEPELHGAVRGERDALLGVQRRREEGRDPRDEGPPVLHGNAVPPGVQQQARGPRADVRRVHEGGQGEQRTTEAEGPGLALGCVGPGDPQAELRDLDRVLGEEVEPGLDPGTARVHYGVERTVVVLQSLAQMLKQLRRRSLRSALKPERPKLHPAEHSLHPLVVPDVHRARMELF